MIHLDKMIVLHKGLATLFCNAGGRTAVRNNGDNQRIRTVVLLGSRRGVCVFFVNEHDYVTGSCH